MAQFNYMSWNVKQLSERKASKEFLKNNTVSAWVAQFILYMKTDMVGVMELTPSTGEAAFQTLKKDINLLSSGSAWDGKISSKTHNSSKGDLCCVLFDESIVEITNLIFEDDDGTLFKVKGRRPAYWQTTVKENKSSIHCLLWHAPQPEDHKGLATIKELAQIAENIEPNKTIPFLISGDFNYDTSDEDVYRPLFDLDFVGLFDGVKSTFTTFKSFQKQLKVLMKEALGSGELTTDDVESICKANAYDNIFLRHLNFSNTVNFFIICEFLAMEENGVLAIENDTIKDVKLAMKLALAISDHVPLCAIIITS